jgi:hypothetical protein
MLTVLSAGIFIGPNVFAHNGVDHTFPQRKAACEGKAAGDNCEFKAHKGGTMNGTCEAKPPKNILACSVPKEESKAHE